MSDRARLAAGAPAAVAAAAGLVAALGTGGRATHARHARRAARSSSRRRATVVRLGRSARGRPIRAVLIAGAGRAAVLVVGCVHGGEPAGIAVTRMLRRTLLKG